MRVPLLLVATAALAAQAPALAPGEVLVLNHGDQEARYGAADVERPMGDLARWVWIQAEGSEWGARDLLYKCTGTLEGQACTGTKPHGKVDLAKATREDCRLAFLAWGRWSANRWNQEGGPDADLIRLEEAFRPFLGRRMPAPSAGGPLAPAWMGQGDLLRTTAFGMVQWFMDPMNGGAGMAAMRHMRPTASLLASPGGVWWIDAVEIPGTPEAWVVGSDARTFAVMRLPNSQGKAADVARFKAVMRVK